MKEFPETHLITLAGSPRQRGWMHGETLRGQIRELIARWKDWLAPAVKMPPGQYLQEFVAQTDFQTAIRRWTPGLFEEVQGIAEGAGVDFVDVFAFQLQDEEWWFGQESRDALQGQARGCSAIGWRGDGSLPSLVAQNMDMPDYLDGYQVILHVKDDQTEVESLVFSAAGLLALNGVNNRSIGIVCNTLDQLNHSRNGLPVAYVHRGVLEKSSFSQAKLFLETIRHASGQNYLLGSPAQVLDLECSANQVAEYARPAPGRGVCHTNHPFANTDFRGLPPGEKPSKETLAEFFAANSVDSRARFEAISRQLGAAETEGLTPEIARRLLSSHDAEPNPVCCHAQPDQRWMTLGTSIMLLDETPQLYVCPGPPCTSLLLRAGFDPSPTK